MIYVGGHRKIANYRDSYPCQPSYSLLYGFVAISIEHGKNVNRNNATKISRTSATLLFLLTIAGEGSAKSAQARDFVEPEYSTVVSEY